MQDKCLYVLIKEIYHKQEVILKMYFQFSYDFREEKILNSIMAYNFLWNLRMASVHVVSHFDRMPYIEFKHIKRNLTHYLKI